MLQQLHQHLTPADLGGELQQGPGGSTANQRTVMAAERLDHPHHRRIGHADRAQGLDQGLAGFLELGAVGHGRSGAGQTTGQAGADRFHRFKGPQFAQGPGRGLPQTVVVVFKGGQEVGHRTAIPQLAQGPGRVAGHGVVLHTSAGIPRLALAQGGAQQGDGVGVPAAHPPQPPGGVVLQRLIVGLSKALQRFVLLDRFACCGDPRIWIGGSSHGPHGAGEGI